MYLMLLGFIIWIVILASELFWFSSVLVGPHSIGDILFVITAILVTLTVGVTGFFLFNEKKFK